jgi:hypothetical protein
MMGLGPGELVVLGLVCVAVGMPVLAIGGVAWALRVRRPERPDPPAEQARPRRNSSPS